MILWRRMCSPLFASAKPSASLARDRLLIIHLAIRLPPGAGASSAAAWVHCRLRRAEPFRSSARPPLAGCLELFELDQRPVQLAFESRFVPG